MEDWRINIDPVLLEAYEMAMAEIRGENLTLAKARILRDLEILSEARKKIAAQKM